MKRFIWLKEIYLSVASELIIETTINIEKLFCFNQPHPDFQRPGLSNYNHMETYGNDFSIILGVWSVMSYFVISFLSSFYLCQKGYITVQKANSFPVYLVFLYMKALYKCSLLYFTNQKFFIKLSPHFVDGKSNTLKC